VFHAGKVGHANAARVKSTASRTFFKDGEPYTLKGVSTVRGGGHAIPAKVNGPYSTQRPDPPLERGYPRCRDGNLLCPPQLPGAPHPGSQWFNRDKFKCLHDLQQERRGRNVPMGMLYGTVVEYMDMSVEEMQSILVRLVGSP
jgi:hypothetical protein